jgi:hypothetical protein
MSNRCGRIAAVVAVVALTVVAATGCGGDEESPQAQWASSFCGALSDWSSTVLESVDTIKDTANLSANSLDEALTNAADATTTLKDDLEELGPPETEAGDEALQQVETYRSALEADAEKLQSESTAPTSGTAGLLQKVSTVTATLASMATSLEGAVTAISQADVEGELQQALEDDSACQDVKQQVEELKQQLG